MEEDILKENENLKQSLIINKNLYEEVCNKSKLQNERNKRQQEENQKLNKKISNIGYLFFYDPKQLTKG